MRRAPLILAAVAGLDTADLSTIGTAARPIEQAFGIGHARLGLLVTISLGVGALGTIPFGMLADRVGRVRLLSGSIALWSLAMVACGAASSYTGLLICRVGLGAVTAGAWPILASFIGDAFPAAERSRVYSVVATGEFAGGAVGILVSGNLAAVSWRWAFWALALPSAALSWIVLRGLREPPRTARGATHAHPVLALRQILGVRTNRILIAGSALGYFYFAGLRTFAVAFLRGRFGVGQSVATLLLVGLGIGAVAGVIVAGRLADRLVRRGRGTARVTMPAVASVAGALVLVPGLLSGSLAVSMPFFVLGAALLASPNPPLDAARLDVVPPNLWGRAESVRSVLRQSGQALAPVLFGVLADALGGSGGQHVGGPGLRDALLIMLVAMVCAGAVIWRARRCYERDSARAVAAGDNVPTVGRPDGPPGRPTRRGEARQCA